MYIILYLQARQFKKDIKYEKIHYWVDLKCFAVSLDYSYLTISSFSKKMRESQRIGQKKSIDL